MTVLEMWNQLTRDERKEIKFHMERMIAVRRGYIEEYTEEDQSDKKQANHQ